MQNLAKKNFFEFEFAPKRWSKYTTIKTSGNSFSIIVSKLKNKYYNSHQKQAKPYLFALRRMQNIKCHTFQS